MSQIQEIQEIDEIQEVKSKMVQEEKPKIVQKEKSNVVQGEEKQSILSYASCRLCPRECKVNRLKGERGFCHAGSIMHTGRAAPHF